MNNTINPDMRPKVEFEERLDRPYAGGPLTDVRVRCNGKYVGDITCDRRNLVLPAPLGGVHMLRPSELRAVADAMEC